MEPNILALLAFGGASTGAAAVLLTARDWFAPKAPAHESAAGVRAFPRLRGDGTGSTVARFDHWFERTVYLSGIPLDVTSATLMFPLVGLTIGGGLYVATDNGPGAVVAALLAMALLLGWMVRRARKRVWQFQEQFPDALDLLSRAVRAGQSLDQATSLVAESSAEPTRTEFRRCAKHLEMGLSVQATMRGLSDRIGLMDVRIFASTLGVHRESGGSLAETLERLSAVIRDRMAYHRQLRSVTSAGRFSAAVVTMLGPLLFAYLFIFQPEYGQILWNDPLGRSLLVYAVISEVIGVIWVLRLLKSDY